MAAALTAVFVLGGLLGYLVGRPSESPVPRGALSPGEVRVPSLTGLRVSDARRVLAPFDLHPYPTRTAHSVRFADGYVLAQMPAPGSGVEPPGSVGIQVSSGPGPPPGPMLIFARSVLIPITRVGPYRWTSPRVALDGPPVSLGANTRVIGHAVVTPYQVARAGDANETAMSISFRVTSYRGPAWYAIVRAFGRQRETPSVGPSLLVQRVANGRAFDVVGSQCRTSGSQTEPMTIERRAPNGHLTFVVSLHRRVSVYAFRVRVKAKEIPGNGRFDFRVGRTACRSSVLVTRP